MYGAANNPTSAFVTQFRGLAQDSLAPHAIPLPNAATAGERGARLGERELNVGFFVALDFDA